MEGCLTRFEQGHRSWVLATKFVSLALLGSKVFSQLSTVKPQVRIQELLLVCQMLEVLTDLFSRS